METITTHMTEIHAQLVEALGSSVVEPLANDSLQVINLPNTHDGGVTICMPYESVFQISCVVIELDARWPWLPDFLAAQRSRLPIVDFEIGADGSLLLVVYKTLVAELGIHEIMDHARWIARIAQETRAALRWAEAGSWL